MCSRNFNFIFACLCCLGLTLSVAAADNDNKEKRLCLNEVKDDFSSCKNLCVEAKKSDKQECGVNPECHKDCKLVLEDCLEPLENQLGTCLDGCNDAQRAGRDACKTQVACKGNCYKNADFLACLRPYSVARYACVLDCKEAHRLDTTTGAAKDACYQASKDCHKACRQVAPEATPAAN